MLLLLEAILIKKSFAGRPVLEIDTFNVYSGDRIGFVGANGSGKTTLLEILAGLSEPDEGNVRRYCEIAYVKQFGLTEGIDDPRRLKEYGVSDKAETSVVSGGEETRLKIARALSEERRLVFADEPTSNLDMEGIARFGEELCRFESFILVSHDRDLLNKYCNKIMTLENCELQIFEGNYEDYRRQAEAKRERAYFEYEQYAAETDRLQKVFTEKKAKAHEVGKKPKGMSSSEMKQRDFTVSSRSNDGRQCSFERAAKAVQARMEHMEVKEKPAEAPRIRMNFALTDPPSNRVVISGKDISLGYDGLVLLDKASFEIKNKSRVALAGANGSGKTTLLNSIWDSKPYIYTVPKARIGYFYQRFEQLDFHKTVLQNALADSVQTEAVVRSVLARLLFTRNEVQKSAGVLSGGERIKLCLAKLLVSRNNILMLDEPTNYLDMPSIEVLQAILGEYEGTVLFVSHDRAFVDALCTDLLVIEDKKIIAFEGNLTAYEKRSAPKPQTDMLILEHKLAALAGELVYAKGEQKQLLEEEYKKIAAEKKRLQSTF